DVKFVTMNSAPDMAVAVIGGSGDFTIPIQSVLRAQLKGQGLVAIGATMNQLIHIVVVSNQALEKAGVTKDEPLEKRTAALKDLRIGITAAGGGADIIMRMLLTRAGLNPDRDATLIALGDGATMVAALETDQIDAYINGSPWPEVPVAHGLGQVIVNIPAG